MDAKRDDTAFSEAVPTGCDEAFGSPALCIQMRSDLSKILCMQGASTKETCVEKREFMKPLFSTTTVSIASFTFIKVIRVAAESSPALSLSVPFFYEAPFSPFQLLKTVQPRHSLCVCFRRPERTHTASSHRPIPCPRPPWCMPWVQLQIALAHICKCNLQFRQFLL